MCVCVCVFPQISWGPPTPQIRGTCALSPPSWTASRRWRAPWPTPWCPWTFPSNFPAVLQQTRSHKSIFKRFSISRRKDDKKKKRPPPPTPTTTTINQSADFQPIHSPAFSLLFLFSKGLRLSRRCHLPFILSLFYFILNFQSEFLLIVPNQRSMCS